MSNRTTDLGASPHNAGKFINVTPVVALSLVKNGMTISGASCRDSLHINRIYSRKK